YFALIESYGVRFLAETRRRPNHAPARRAVDGRISVCAGAARAHGLSGAITAGSPLDYASRHSIAPVFRRWPTRSRARAAGRLLRGLAFPVEDSEQHANQSPHGKLSRAD